MKKIRKTHPAFINSSYSFLLVSFVALWSWLLSSAFPEQVRTTAFIFLCTFSLFLIVIDYLLNQSYDLLTAPRLIICYFFATALMTVASSMRGPIADGHVPVIRILFFGPAIYADSTPSQVYASVFPFYGSVSLSLALISSALLEWLYTSLYKFIPKPIKRKLKKFDRKIDKNAENLSDKYFFFNDEKGTVALFSVLCLYILIYFFLLIF